MNQVYIVWVTTPNKRTSEQLMRLVVDGKMAACANRIPGLTSRYWWKGRIETSREELLIFKTTAEKLPALTKAVRLSHPYRVCEVVATPVVKGNASYLKWVRSSLRG